MMVKTYDLIKPYGGSNPTNNKYLRTNSSYYQELLINRINDYHNSIIEETLNKRPMPYAPFKKTILGGMILLIVVILIYFFTSIRVSDFILKMDLQGINKELTSHFPSKIKPEASLSIGDDVNDEPIIYCLLVPNVSEEEIVKFTNEIEKDIIEVYKPNDHHLTVAYRKSHIFSRNLKTNKIDNFNKNNKYYYPIPFFSLTGEEYFPMHAANSKSGLTDDCTIYLLNSKPGIYWDGLEGIDYMPDGWKYGYSKGYVVYLEKERGEGNLIYWFIVW